MNWTGGKLHRHSKANADDVAKRQKQYFAKARQRLASNRAPHVPSDIQEAADLNLSLKHFELGSPSRRKASHSTVLSRGQSDCRQSLNENNPSSKSSQLRADSTKRHDHQPSRPGGSPEPLLRQRTLDDVKQKLLRHKDWSDLSALKPLRLKFRSADEIANIARRRKITSEDKSRQQRGFEHERLPTTFRNWSHQRPMPESEDISIRVGSNIHQSPPTFITVSQQPSKQTNTGTQAKRQEASPESMLLDQEAPRIMPHQVSSGPEAYSGRPQLVKHACKDTRQVPASKHSLDRDEFMRDANVDVEEALPTLDKFIGSESFDDVKRRSASKSTSAQAPIIYPSSPPPRPTWDKDGGNPFVNIIKGLEACDDQHAEVWDERWHPPRLPKLHSRPMFTIEKQIQENASSQVASDRMATSRESSDPIPLPPMPKLTARFHRKRPLPAVTEQHRSPTQLTEQNPASGHSDTEHNDVQLLRNQLGHTECQEEHQAWMKFVLGDELEEINSRFRFQQHREHPSFNPKRRRIIPDDMDGQSSSLQPLTWTTGRGSQPKLITTAANTTICAARDEDSQQQSETDFLSQLSPMEGVIDERLRNPSLYANAPQTERSFLVAPSIDSIHQAGNHEMAQSRVASSLWSDTRQNSDRLDRSSEHHDSNSQSIYGDSVASQSRHGMETARPTLQDISQWAGSGQSIVSNSTPKSNSNVEQVSSYFRSPDLGTIRDGNHTFSDASMVTERSNKSTHRQPLGNFHVNPLNPRPASTNKMPTFISNIKSSPGVSKVARSFTNKFRIPKAFNGVT